jgi:hypothetical protein
MTLRLPPSLRQRLHLDINGISQMEADVPLLGSLPLESLIGLTIDAWRGVPGSSYHGHPVVAKQG